MKKRSKPHIYFRGGWWYVRSAVIFDWSDVDAHAFVHRLNRKIAERR